MLLEPTTCASVERSPARPFRRLTMSEMTNPRHASNTAVVLVSMMILVSFLRMDRFDFEVIGLSGCFRPPHR